MAQRRRTDVVSMPPLSGRLARYFVMGLPVFSVVMSYLLPALFHWQDVQYLTNPLLRPEFIEPAATYAAGALAIYLLLLVLFPVRDVAPLGFGWGASFKRLDPLVYTVLAVMLAVMCHLFYVLAMGGYDALISPSARFYVAVPWAKSLGVVLGFLSLIIYGMLGPGRVWGLLLLAANAAIYSFSISSRSSSIFFLLATLVLLSRRRWGAAAVFFTVAVLVYVDAILGRSTLGVGRIMSAPDWLEYLVDLPLVVFVFYDTFSALQTLTIAFSVGPIAQVADWGSFLTYISPVPSSLLDVDSFRQYQSLSYHMGIDVGINSDIMSETYLWFGWLGMMAAALFYYFGYRVICSRAWGAIYPLLVVGYVYFCVMSNVGSLRAASRPFVYVIVGYVCLRALWWLGLKARKLVKRSEAPRAKQSAAVA